MMFTTLFYILVLQSVLHTVCFTYLKVCLVIHVVMFLCDLFSKILIHNFVQFLVLHTLYAFVVIVMLICEIFGEILIIQISPRQNIHRAKTSASNRRSQNVGVKTAESKRHVPFIHCRSSSS